MAEHMLSTAVWGDGAGSTLKATLEAIHEEIVDFEVDTVFTTDPKAGILDVVSAANRDFGMDIKPVVLFKSEKHRRQSNEAQEEFLRQLTANGVGNVVMMGCVVIIGEEAVWELNGNVPEEPLPRTLEEAKELLVTGEKSGELWLPDDFPKIVNTGKFGLMNTHPAPTIVTANTHGEGAQERMIRLRSRNSAVTFHAAAPGIDTGPIAAAHKFLVDLPPINPDEDTVTVYAKKLNKWAQRVEKATLPTDTEIHLRNREEYLRAA